MEVFLIMNGMEIRASVDEQERLMLSLTAGKVSREALTDWLRSNVADSGSES
jgi:death-on-curing protein